MNTKNSRTILIHVISWLFIFSLPFLNFIFKPEELLSTNKVFLFIPVLFTLFLCGIFYGNLLWVAPKLLNRRFWWLYTLVVLLGFVLYYNYNIGVFRFVVIPQIPLEDRQGPGENEEWRNTFRFVFPLLFYSLTILISNILHLLNEKRKEREISRKIEFQKVEAELSILKLQISPHFLFNTLNNIRWLVRKKSEDSEESIMKLSEVLRYIIYDVDTEKVSIKKEVEHLKNYINLQSLRIQADAEVDFQVDPAAETLHIAPLLFIHFVENAFKYGVDGKNTPEIKMQIEKTANGILFTCKNKILNPGNSLENEGVGIQNVKRRLDLLYPGRHQLEIEEKDGYFKVAMQLEVNEN
ncbi:sensor histidine kinase [Jiulongibacter sediminis]|uniref:sensor histidine kinase n=1 Tax=Jiulongibacter sediminis TaxID=1605367 RepID=UPI0026EFFCE7|nr:sensor histidine kinase [Jiulongibacter sediminis]